MVDTQLLESKIAESGKTKTHICKKLGCALQTFKAKTDNKFPFTLDEVDILREELNITTLGEMEKIFHKK